MLWLNPILNPGIPDGQAKRLGVTARDVDQRELERGTRHEPEHTTSRRIARQIALDHLSEDKFYYRKLARMERGACRNPWNNPVRSLRDPKTMTASEINRELDSLDKKQSKLIDEFIKAGRGNERASETAKKTDPLANRYNEISNRQYDLRHEISRRYGPGAPSRLPRGLGPIRANPLSELWASSKDRYRASAKERRLYGGSTVTEFYVGKKGDEDDASKWVVQVGYGRTPGERKTDAMRRAAPRLGVVP